MEIKNARIECRRTKYTLVVNIDGVDQLIKTYGKNSPSLSEVDRDYSMFCLGVYFAMKRNNLNIDKSLKKEI